MPESANEPNIRIIKEPISLMDLKNIAVEWFGEMAKAVVDIEQGIMAVGGDLHADEEALLLENESRQADLWGINLYPNATGENFIEFDSMINLRPNQNNRSRGVDDPAIREKIIAVVHGLVTSV